VLREALFPVKLLKTLAKAPVDFDSELWAASPAVGDIEDGVLGSGVGRCSIFPSNRQSVRESIHANHDEERNGKRAVKRLSWE